MYAQKSGCFDRVEPKADVVEADEREDETFSALQFQGTMADMAAMEDQEEETK